MDQKYANLIYLDKESNRFAFLFILMFLLIPNVTAVIALFIIYGKEDHILIQEMTTSSESTETRQLE